MLTRIRRHKKLTATLAAGTILTLAGVAIALLLLRAPVAGGGTVVTATGFRFTAVAVTGHTGSVDCSAALASGTATVNLANALTGDTCSLRFTVQRTGLDQDMRIQDFRFSSTTDEGFLGTMNVDGCRAPVPLAPATLDVPVKITVPTGAAEGAFSAQADAGMFAVSVADYIDASCPRAS